MGKVVKVSKYFELCDKKILKHDELNGVLSRICVTDDSEELESMILFAFKYLAEYILLARDAHKAFVDDDAKGETL